MPFAAYGSLGDVLRDDGQISCQDAKTIMFQLLSGLECLRAAGIVHRDIKPTNKLLGLTHTLPPKSGAGDVKNLILQMSTCTLPAFVRQNILV